MAHIGSANANAPPSAATFSTLRRMKNILGGSAGNFVEYFDWWVYLSFAIYYSSAMFPKDDQTTQLLKSYLPFAAGFLSRPIGAYFLGAFADRAGRKAALSLAVGLMSFGALMIALIPTTGPALALAPYLLTLARVIQGLSLGGEYGASATYVSEMSTRRHRGFWSGFLYVTIAGGQLAGVLLLVALQHLLTEAQLTAWGWRIPFAVGALFAVSVYWMQTRLHETPSFEATRQVADRGRTMLLFTKHPKASLITFLLTAAGGSGFYFYSSYMKDFLVNSAAGPAGHGFSKDSAALIMTALLVCFIFFQPLVGGLSDRIGRRRILLIGFGGGALVAYPILVATAASTSALQAFLLLLIPMFLISSYSALSGIVKAEMFPSHIRALGVALPYSIAQAVFGGNVGAMALSLKKAGHEPLMFAIIAGFLAVGFITICFMRETRDHSLIVED